MTGVSSVTTGPSLHICRDRKLFRVIRPTRGICEASSPSRRGVYLLTASCACLQLAHRIASTSERRTRSGRCGHLR